MTNDEKQLATMVHKATCKLLMAYIPATVWLAIDNAGLLQGALIEAIHEWKELTDEND